FDFMDGLVGEKLCIFETAGSLRGGRRVWMLARIPKEYRVGSGDLVNPYVLLANSHDGSMALRMIPTTVRVVCQNTLNLALRKSSVEGIRVYHSESLEARVREARLKLGIITKRLDRFGEEIQALARRQLTQQELTRYFVELVKGRSERSQKAMLHSLLSNFESPQNNLKGMTGTLWAAFNSVSEFADHQ